MVSGTEMSIVSRKEGGIHRPRQKKAVNYISRDLNTLEISRKFLNVPQNIQLFVERPKLCEMCEHGDIK